MKKSPKLVILFLVLLLNSSNQLVPSEFGNHNENESGTFSYFATTLKLIAQNILSTNLSMTSLVEMFFPCTESMLWNSKYLNKRLLKNMYAPSTIIKRSIEPQITWIGHSTFLIQCCNVNILTDPVFGHLNKLLYQRNIAPGIKLEHLPEIDVIIVSHNHRDHLEGDTLDHFSKLDKKPQLFVPGGDKLWICNKHNYPDENVSEFKWGEQISVNLKCENHAVFTFLPASHTSGRYLFDHNKSLWGSWMIEFRNKVNENEKFFIYFGGDTAYRNHFKKIGKKFKKIDIALLPIGPNEPRTTMNSLYHMSAEESLKALSDLNAKTIIPMHYLTFRQGTDNLGEAHKRLIAEAKKTKAMDKITFLKIGERKKF